MPSELVIVVTRERPLSTIAPYQQQYAKHTSLSFIAINYWSNCRRDNNNLPLVEDESCNESGERIQGERDSQTTLSFELAVPMSETKTDSPFICTVVLFLLSVCVRTQNMLGFVDILYVCAKVREITEEISLSLRGIGRAGCWERVEMTNGLLCN